MNMRARGAAEVAIPIDGSRSIAGILRVPPRARGIVAFAHGSGSGRHSKRNRAVAAVLEDAGFATLLVDLLTPAEEAIDLRTGELRFDIPLLAERLVSATDWLARQPACESLPVGYFGASTGAAAAIVAAAARPAAVRAVVSRGGRPDLAGDALDRIAAPTLFIVGGADRAIIPLNRSAMARMKTATAWHEIPGATHLFEEPGALDAVARAAAAWFDTHLSRAQR